MANNSGNSQFTINVSILCVTKNLRKLMRLETVDLIGLDLSLSKEKRLEVLVTAKGFSELIPMRTTSSPLEINSF